ncbi:MAG: phytanoyl-CoA dioxygenase family protein [Actinobacteria bacterium]|nr:phytanoyl-CoA dioxygenase family protein [Actinomycetota bacterium]
MTEAIAASESATEPMSAEQRAIFDRDGYLIIRGALRPDEVAVARDALDSVYAAAAAAGSLAPDGSMHLLSAITNCPVIAYLIDHPATFRYVWSVLGWNIHVYHSHLDVHPPIRAPMPFRFDWHQDGGRQNREIETTPRPRLSVKVAYWLSDVSQPGRGNLKVVPGSHVVNWIEGPPRRDVEWPDPEGAVEVTAGPGDAVLFDRRIWHTRSRNYSEHTRKAVFFGYTYRWTAIRDDVAALLHSERSGQLTPVQRQLLGGIQGDNGDHAWGHYPDDTPLYCWLKERGLLDAASLPLRP